MLTQIFNVDLRGMNSYHCVIFFMLLQLKLGIPTTILKGQTFVFPVPEFSVGTSVNEIEWKYHTSNKTILLARILFNQNQKHDSKIYSKGTGMHIMENGTLYIEDIKLEDSGNYSCTFIFHDQRTQKQQIHLQVLPDPKEHIPVHNSTSKPSEPNDPDTSLIAILVCSAFSLVLIVAAIVIFRRRRKCCCTSKEPIYINKAVVHKARK